MGILKMGIDTRVYMMYGVRHDTKDHHEFFHFYNELVDPSSDDAKVWMPDELPTVVLEGMDSKSFVLGTVLFKTSSFRWDFTAGDVSTSYFSDEMKFFEDCYKEDFIKFFPDFYHLLEKPFKILTFINFS